MTYQTLKVAFTDRTAVLTLNRPEAMNAMDFTMMRELADFFEALHQESDIQLLVVKGEGRVFSAGGDVKAMLQSGDPNDFGDIMGDISRLVRAYYTLPMITIAQVHGAAAGLGLSLALGSDVILAEQSSKIAMNFIGIGLVPDGGGHFFMKERLGTVKAKQLIWEGRVMNGDEAKEIEEVKLTKDDLRQVVDLLKGNATEYDGKEYYLYTEDDLTAFYEKVCSDFIGCLVREGACLVGGG